MSATAAAPPGRRGAVLAVVALVAAFHYLVLFPAPSDPWMPGVQQPSRGDRHPGRPSAGMRPVHPPIARVHGRVLSPSRGDTIGPSDPVASVPRMPQFRATPPFRGVRSAADPGQPPSEGPDTPLGTGPEIRLRPVASVSAPTAPAPSAVPRGGSQPLPFRLPEPFSVDFAFRRGELSGPARLTWSHDASTYVLHLTAWDGAGRILVLEESRGSLGESGPVPIRFTSSRSGHATRAVNFVRGEGGEPDWIGFSASSRRLRWDGAVHDRLSWVIQLAGLTCAQQDAAQLAPILLAVAGPSGDLQTWRLDPQAEAGAFEGRSDAAYGTSTSLRLDRTAGCRPSRLVFADAGAPPIELDASAPTMHSMGR